MRFIIFAVIAVLVVAFAGCEAENPFTPTPADAVKIAGCITDIEKSEGKHYTIRADATCIDSIFNTPTDIITTEPESHTLTACTAPFGVDSQQILNDGMLDHNYKIGVVSDIDLERNDDGTWYINKCRILSRTLYFQSPHPQQNEINDGDIIGFQASTDCNTTWRGTTCWYTSGKLIENISLQSTDCQTDDVSQLSNPSTSMPILASKDDFVDVAGLIIAVETIKNLDSEPDNSADYHATKAVMKCADGNLYRVDFVSSYRALTNLGSKELKSIVQSESAFGEGDVITVKQTFNLHSDSLMAYDKP